MRSNYLTLFVVMCTWMVDSGQSLLYSYAIGGISQEWGITPTMASLIGFMPMAAAAVGGPIFGYIADKYGRKVSLQIAIAIVGLSCLAIAFAQNPTQMVIARTIAGLVLGGVWTAGMTLISELWEPKTRGKAVAIVQIGFPLGFLYASLCTYFFAATVGWRGAYVACAVPTMLIFFMIRFFVKESPVWFEMKEQGKAITQKSSVPIQELFSKEYSTKVVVASLIAFLGMYGYWAVMTWIPSYLEVAGFKAKEIPLWTFYILSGAVLGYLVHGGMGDRYGRRKAFGLFFIGTAAMTLIFGLLPVYLNKTSGGDVARMSILIAGPILSFFTGYFSGYGVYYSELFPTKIRASASGFCFNIGRIGTAVGPGMTGAFAASYGVGSALAIASLTFLICAVLIFLLPETYGTVFSTNVKKGSD